MQKYEKHKHAVLLRLPTGEYKYASDTIQETIHHKIWTAKELDAIRILQSEIINELCDKCERLKEKVKQYESLKELKDKEELINKTKKELEKLKERKNKKIRELRKDIRKLNKKYKEAKKDNEDLLKDLAKKRAKIMRLEKEIQRIK